MTTTIQVSESDTVVTLTFELAVRAVRGGAIPEVRGCRFELYDIIPRGSRDDAAYFSTDSGDEDQIREAAARRSDSDVYSFDQDHRSRLLEIPVTEAFPPVVLAAEGAIPRQLSVEHENMTLTVEVPPRYDVNSIVSRFTDAYPDAELTTRRRGTVSTPPFSEHEFQDALARILTDRQQDVLETAHDEGFYEWPRQITGEQLGELFDITPATLQEHLRTAEQKMVGLAFAGHGRRPDP